MPGSLILSEVKDPDLGLIKFTFLHENKPYTVVPKPLEPNEDSKVMNSRYERMEDFLKYVKFVCKKPNVNPFQFKNWQQDFTIRPAGPGNKQGSVFVSDELRTWNEIREAYAKAFGPNHHHLRLKCSNCDNTMTCRCTQPKITEYGLCNDCAPTLIVVRTLDKVANSLEDKGRLKEAHDIDVITNTIVSCWECNHVNLFSDEIQNQGIPVEVAKKVLDIANTTTQQI